jgi:hypothetical protein
LKYRIMTKAAASATTILVALVLTAGALAASKPPAYRGAGPTVQSHIQGAAHGVAPKTVGVLPFTGLDLALFVGAGLALLLTGGMLRRLGKRRA